MLLRASWSLFLFVSVVAYSQDPPTTWTQRANFGFQGDVRSSLITRTRLTDDPRPADDRRLSVVSPPNWVVFDRAGYMIEIGTAQNGEPSHVRRIHLDAEGNEVGSDSADGHWDNKRRTLPDGSRRVDTYHNGDPQFSVVEDSQDGGRLTKTRTYDGNGILVGENTTEYDNAGRVVHLTFFSRDHHFVSDFTDRYDDDGHLVARSQFDEQGRLLANITVNKDFQLTSYWASPDFKNPNLSLGFTFSFNKTVNYSIHNGELETTVQNHPGRYGNIENDDQERTGAAGKLLEKIAVAYDRDSNGNWTSRTISIWDPKTDAMIPIERDTRTITYY